MHEQVFYKKSGDVSSVRKKLTNNIFITRYPGENNRGGLTFSGKFVSARFGKDNRLISYGFSNGKKTTYFDRNNRRIDVIGQF